MENKDTIELGIGLRGGFWIEKIWGVIKSGMR